MCQLRLAGNVLIYNGYPGNYSSSTVKTWHGLSFRKAFSWYYFPVESPCIPAVLCSDMSVFDPTVNEEYYGKKNCNKNKGSEKFWFPEEQKDKQQYCYADNKVRMVSNNCEGTWNTANNKWMFNKGLPLFTAEDSVKFTVNVKD